MKDFLSTYLHRQFILNNGEFDLTTINRKFSSILTEYGFDLANNEKQTSENGIVLYPIEVLCGFDVENWHEKVTENTVGIHHMGNSWATPAMKRHIKRLHFFQKILGYDNYDKLKRIIKP